MASYHTFTTARVTPPDLAALQSAVQAGTGDPTATVLPLQNGWRGKKANAWSAGDITATQNALDTTAAMTPQLSAQRTIDSFPIEYRALVLALVDAINTLRTHAAINLPAITAAQAITSIRNKAATLS